MSPSGGDDTQLGALDDVIHGDAANGARKGAISIADDDEIRKIRALSG